MQFTHWQTHKAKTIIEAVAQSIGNPEALGWSGVSQGPKSEGRIQQGSIGWSNTKEGVAWGRVSARSPLRAGSASVKVRG